jgi:hypothetical protein
MKNKRCTTWLHLTLLLLLATGLLLPRGSAAETVGRTLWSFESHG